MEDGEVKKRKGNTGDLNPKHQTKLTKVFVPRKFATIMNEKKKHWFGS